MSEAATSAGELRAIADRYTVFAQNEARGASDIYERLAHAVAGSSEILAFLATLPAERRQPNLFLGAVRQLFGVPDDEGTLVEIVRGRHAAIRALMLARTTQTNEPARCAILLPLLARLPQPLALIEVGASAGLCLLADRYGYDYGGRRLEPDGIAGHPTFACQTSGPVPLPNALPTIAWRAGLDLNPIDVHSVADTAWLETLVWPEQEHRAKNLRAALAVARRDPPRVVQGDLLTDLSALMGEAPKDATLVVFHTAVLAYVAKAGREKFAAAMGGSGARWISNEAPGAFPAIARAAPAAPRPGLFLMAIDSTPVAWAGPHGQSIDWFGG